VSHSDGTAVPIFCFTVEGQRTRLSSSLATTETLRPRCCPYALGDSLFRQNTLYVSFNPRCLLVHLTFHVFREDAHTASVGFVVRLSGLFGLFRLSRPAPDGQKDGVTTRQIKIPSHLLRFTLHGSGALRRQKLRTQYSELNTRFTFHDSRFTSSHCQLAAKKVCTSFGF
jgi:hypothetical protein